MTLFKDTPKWERAAILFCIFVAAMAIGASFAMARGWYTGPWHRFSLVSSAYAADGSWADVTNAASSYNTMTADRPGHWSINPNTCCAAGMKISSEMSRPQWDSIGSWFRSLTGWYSGSWYTGGWYSYSSSTDRGTFGMRAEPGPTGY